MLVGPQHAAIIWTKSNASQPRIGSDIHTGLDGHPMFLLTQIKKSILKYSDSTHSDFGGRRAAQRGKITGKLSQDGHLEEFFGDN